MSRLGQLPQQRKGRVKIFSTKCLGDKGVSKSWLVFHWALAHCAPWDSNLFSFVTVWNFVNSVPVSLKLGWCVISFCFISEILLSFWKIDLVARRREGVLYIHLKVYTLKPRASTNWDLSSKNSKGTKIGELPFTKCFSDAHICIRDSILQISNSLW